MATRKIPMKDVDFTKIHSKAPVQKTIPNGTGQTYWVIPIVYDYGKSGSPVLGDLDVEFPRMKIPFGIHLQQEKQDPNKPSQPKKENAMPTYNLFTKLSPDDSSRPVDREIIDFCMKLYTKYAEIVDIHSGTVGWLFSKDTPEMCQFQHILFTPNANGKPSTLHGQKGTESLFFMKLIYAMTKKGEIFRTPFMICDSKNTLIEKSWEDLMGLGLEVQPVINFGDIFIGSTRKPRNSVRSALVTDVFEIRKNNSQKDTAERLMNEDKSVLEVSSKIADLGSLKKAQVNDFINNVSSAAKDVDSTADKMKNLLLTQGKGEEKKEPTQVQQTPQQGSVIHSTQNNNPPQTPSQPIHPTSNENLPFNPLGGRTQSPGTFGINFVQPQYQPQPQQHYQGTPQYQGSPQQYHPQQLPNQGTYSYTPHASSNNPMSTFLQQNP